MAGDGNYGGNGSIHWRSHSGSVTAAGADPTPVAQIGGNTGNFRLKLRYTTLSGKSIGDLTTLLTDLINAATAARTNLSGTSTDETITIFVPAIPRSTPPLPNTELEVHVDW